ncbi:chemotaxis protein CheW [Sphingomonas parva]|uniref:Chemotaxis protein CheW n=1 Tax=Sphingomonas parva TaxID=2555898 RepID=A0A4Y8ZV05_9SPHN|nr:chemotaxis protein CheW [Sphingomonas parva]TFI59307.1 chemotaxis protein CheW [Sphingomonas parva]
MAELLLIVTLAGEQVAVLASEVESVVEVEGLTPVPRAGGHVAGLTALRSRVLTVIDCMASLEPGGRIDNPRDAIVVVADGHPYALLVDRVEDVVEAEGEIAPVPASLASGWAGVATGYVPAEGRLFLLVDIHALIAGPTAEAA